MTPEDTAHCPLVCELLAWIAAQLAAADDELAVADWIDQHDTTEEAC